MAEGWYVGEAGAGGGSSFSDDFNRANNSSTLGSPWQTFSTNSVYTSVWGVSSNQAQMVSNGGPGGTAVAYVASGASDVQIDFDCPSMTSFAEIAAFRFDPAGGTPANRTGFILAQNALFYLPAGGAGVLIASGLPYASGDHVTIVANGTTITLKRNGTTVATVTNGNNLTVQNHGLASSTTTNRYDNFTVTPLAASGFEGWS